MYYSMKIEELLLNCKLVSGIDVKIILLEKVTSSIISSTSMLYMTISEK